MVAYSGFMKEGNLRNAKVKPSNKKALPKTNNFLDRGLKTMKINGKMKISISQVSIKTVEKLRGRA